MKFTFILSLLVLFVNSMSYAQVHSCIDIFEETTGDANTMSGVFSEHAKWSNGAVIKVRFSGGQTSVRQKVQKYAKIWEEYANITFSFVNSGPCDILITFQKGKGSWSYIGKQSRNKASSNQASINFGWFDSSTPDYEVKRTTLHEFGHALGLFHEHTHTSGGIKWNKPVVYNYYMNQGWSIDKINQNIFGKYSVQLSNRKYDKNSIMHYPIPKEHTLDGQGVDINYVLSTADKELIAEMYPKPKRKPKGDVYTISSRASVMLDDIDVNHNVVQWGKKGLEILIDFDIENALSKDCRATAYFYYSSGKALKDFNNSYCTVGGDVSVGTDFEPSYKNSTYTDLKLFIPYDELHMGDGEHELKFTVTLWDDKENSLINSGAYYFTYSKGAIIENFNLTTNTTHSTDRMFLIPKFTVKNAEGVNCSACASFYNSRKEPLYDIYGNNLTFCTDFRPGYKTALYNALDISDLNIPVFYNSIPLPKGTSKVYYFVGIHSGGKQVFTGNWESISLTRW